MIGIDNEPPARVVAYALGFTAFIEGRSFSATMIPEVDMKPQRLLSNVEKGGLVEVQRLVIHGADQIVGGPMDAYLFSYIHGAELDAAFLKAHRLTAASDDEIQAFLDNHDLEMPSASIGRLDLPSFFASQSVELHGRILTAEPVKGPLYFSLIGLAKEPIR